MTTSSREFDLAAILQVVLLKSSHSGDLSLITTGLPAWWHEEIGVVHEPGRLSVRSPVLQDYLEDAHAFWQAGVDGFAPSILFQEGSYIEAGPLVEAIAIRHAATNLLLLRDLKTSEAWITPTLQAARSSMLQQDREQATHRHEVAQMTASLVEARRQEQLKSRMVADLSHEIRTPLATILGLVSAAQTADEAKRNDYLDVISSAANEMLALGNSILDLSKVQSGKLKLNSHAFSLVTFANQLAVQWQTLAASRNLAFELALGDDLPDRVYGDEMRLRQVLSNLLTNALKFTEQGKVTLAIQRASDQQRLQFSVADTGIGMSEADLSSIFEPFTQVSDANRHEGAGLGLTIANQLVRTMGGEIRVESTPAEGSRFWFEIPWEDPEPTQLAAEDTPESQLRCDHVRVLVAEDHALNRSIIVEMLTSADAVVSEAANGQEAVEQAQTQEFDVILMDFQMPVLKGPEAIQQIREKSSLNSQTAIILLTAYELEGGDAQFDGVDRCLVKPIEGPKLIRHVLELTSSNTKNASDGVDR